MLDSQIKGNLWAVCLIVSPRKLPKGVINTQLTQRTGCLQQTRFTTIIEKLCAEEVFEVTKCIM